MAVVNPYLNFEDNCEEAFLFYQSVFGGEFINFMRYEQMECDNPAPASENKKVMHVALPIGNGSVLMGSDTPAAMGHLTVGNNYSIAVGADNVEEAKRLFDGLAAGGEVTMPMDKTFFAEAFGMCTDKFKVHWMVVCAGCQQ